MSGGDPVLQLVKDLAWALQRFVRKCETDDPMIEGGESELFPQKVRVQRDIKSDQHHCSEALATTEQHHGRRGSCIPKQGECLGDYLKRLRLLKGWKVAGTAYRSGLSVDTIKRMEAGDRPPARSTLMKMATLYKVDFGTLATMPRTRNQGKGLKDEQDEAKG